MKAAVLIKQNEPLQVQCFKQARPAGHQVLVRIHKSGLCGAQLNELLGIKGPDLFLPHLMGHEGSGVVEAIGDSVRKVSPGDRVVLHWRKGSGGEGPFPRYEAQDGGSVGGGHVTSFANMALIAENRVTRIDPDIPFDIACLFGCGISTGYGIIHNELKLKSGASLAVIGCGGVGLNVLQAAALEGAGLIVAVDRHSGPKEELARKMGAGNYLKLEKPEELNSALRGLKDAGFDAVVDTTGDTRLMAEAFKALGKNGTLMLVGQPKHDAMLTLSPALDLFTGKRLLVSEGGGFQPDRDMPRLQELYRKHPAAMQQVITHSYKLEQINEAFTTLKSGLCGRILIDMNADS
jgi:S-(hydroxymethyl)glutathione dehydrogenase / alcohol dehydrogenase